MIVKFVLLGLLSIPISSVLTKETWLEYGSVVASDATDGGEQFGGAVAISKTTMVVGDPWYGDDDEGRAYVFYFNKGLGKFEEQHVLLPGEATTYFGGFVAVDDDTIVVGAPDSNAAYVFVKDATGKWPLQQKLTANFGQSVAVDGDRIVVGARSAKALTGIAYVFERSDSSWNQTQILTPSDDPVDAFFGASVELEGDTIVVGANGRNSNMGAVYVFWLNDANTWEETKILQASDGTSDLFFGTSVALTGSNIAVGAYGANKAYVYTGPDFQETKLLQGDGTLNDFFGYSIAILGDTAVVGAPFGDNGAIYVFKRTDDSWCQVTKLTSSESNRETLGYAVTISRDFVVSGAIQSDLAAAGAVYVFVKDPDTQPPFVAPYINIMLILGVIALVGLVVRARSGRRMRRSEYLVAGDFSDGSELELQKSYADRHMELS
jgi:hypothetical protein